MVYNTSEHYFALMFIDCTFMWCRQKTNRGKILEIICCRLTIENKQEKMCVTYVRILPPNRHCVSIHDFAI